VLLNKCLLAISGLNFLLQYSAQSMCHYKYSVYCCSSQSLRELPTAVCHLLAKLLKTALAYPSRFQEPESRHVICCESFKWVDTDTQLDSDTFHTAICHTNLSARIPKLITWFIFSVVTEVNDFLGIGRKRGQTGANAILLSLSSLSYLSAFKYNRAAVWIFIKFGIPACS